MFSSIQVEPKRWIGAFVALLLAVAWNLPAAAEWVEFADETATRLVGPADVDEKDYAWGDVDQDGDIDLVVVRKEDFTSPGKRVNYLYINESGVLVERTADFAVTSDVSGDLGFDTATNDRDVELVDVDLDGWLDIVTAVTISDGDLKHIGHPRVYMNLGCTGACNGTADWLGFRHEDARIPTMRSWTLELGFNPRFCSVAYGDVTGDGYPDLWFGDYDSSGAGGADQPPGADYNDRLLINQGAANPGFFTDATLGSSSHFSGLIAIPGVSGQPFAVSAFGAAGEIADMDGDGFPDIVKQTSLNSPLYVGVAYNTPDDEGFFDTYEVLVQNSPYFISVNDLNNDGQMDVVITDDGDDRYLINQGNGADGLADFASFPFSFSHDGSGGPSEDDGFGSNSVISDLDNDGWKDVLIADVDVDIGGCTRRMHIYHNLGGQPGDDVVLEEETEGEGCETFSGNPASCTVARIPSNKLEGVHDVAVFDLDGDGWKDMVVGRCGGTEVYINQPPAGVSFSFPQGLPPMVPPGQTAVVQFSLLPFGGATITPGTAKMFVSIAGGAFVETAATDLGGNLYEATLPAAGCLEDYRFYFAVDIVQSGTFTDPPGAPLASYSAIAALGTQVALLDDVEGDISAWTISSDAQLTSGEWEQAIPVGTLSGAGAPAAPDHDAESDPAKLQAFVTQNGVPEGAAFAADVDGGPTQLISPPVDLGGTDGILSFYRWFFTSNDDALTVELSSDGTNWVPIEIVTGIEDNLWQSRSFRVGEFVTPSSTVQVRFTTSDFPDNSLTEAAIDLVKFERYVCTNCVTNPDCSDGLFCNGDETCNGGACASGPDNCPGQQCDDVTDVCVDCLIDAHCSDGLFCNGDETCSASNNCLAGGAPCPGEFCEEITDTCADCLTASDCDDGLFCNGPESCVGGSCFAGAEPCPGQFCDEADDACLGVVPLQPRMGEALVELNAFQKARFSTGKIDFERNFDVNDGLGPVFNQDSCGSCHSTPVGGFGTIEVTRFGQVDVGTGIFDPLESLGGSLLQAEAISGECAESIPPEANITAKRLTPSILGFGLIEAIPDASIQALADNPPAGVSGRVHIVEIPEEAPGTTGVGRFGWKSQAARVMSFSAGAALNEMGITNRVHQDDVAPNGDAGLLAVCDTVADPEDGPDQTGQHFIDRVTDFQRFLAPPPQTPKAGMTGEAIFDNIGCNRCHVSTFTTADLPSLELALRNKTVKPYSDFLLHDMGGNADQIADGDAGSREMRTAPLLGVRIRDPLWHDGRVAGGSFAERIHAAVTLHDDGFSEAQASAQAFAALAPVDQDALVAFLDSLGRAEFDFDGDGDVDLDDWGQFNLCYSGTGGFYTPDDSCSIGDVDSDGDVDDADFLLFLAASMGAAAGEVPDGDSAPGIPLTVDRQADGQLTLAWGSSCSTFDSDYAVYVGTLGDFTSHASELCSTGSTESVTFDPPDDVYILVVSHNGSREGSYGVDSSGTPRQRSLAGACFPQETGACE